MVIVTDSSTDLTRTSVRDKSSSHEKRTSVQGRQNSKCPLKKKKRIVGVVHISTELIPVKWGMKSKLVRKRDKLKLLGTFATDKRI